MARSTSYGYLNVGTTRYGYTGVVQYGSGWEYGINYPPPVPENLTVRYYPTTIDQTPAFSWTNPEFEWDLPYGDADAILYELQISYEDSTFVSITSDTNEFSAPDLTYTLAPEYELQLEGTYYARIRSTDGYTYSTWSDTLTFILFFHAPYPPTIDEVTNPADDFWQSITGTKETALYIYIRNNGGAWQEVTYPDGVSGTTWECNLPLTPGANNIEVVSAIIRTTEGGISKPVEANIYLIFNTPEVFNVWNCFDEFGLLLSLSRIPGETNSTYKDRLLDVYTNPANSTYSGLRYGIARELGLSYDDVSIENLSDLADPDYTNNILNDDENAIGTKLESYVDEVYAHNPIFWGTVISDESYWDSIDEQDGAAGYSYLPHLWDPNASGIHNKWQHGGIGDNDDLWVKKPREIWVPGISGYSWYLPVHTGYFYSIYPSGIISI